jgi:integrase
MTRAPLRPEGERSNPTAAIRARAKEKIRSRAQRYQRGSLIVRKRKSLPDVWVFRYYTEDSGRRVYKKQTIGTVVEFPKRKDAEKAVSQLRIAVNEGAAFAPMNLEQLAAHYKNVELPTKAHSTQAGYSNFLSAHVLPKWGKHSLAAVRSVEVETWLGGLNRKDGQPASPATKAKIRNLMSALFSHAIRHEWSARNPITAVRTSAKRLHEPDILTPKELQGLLKELPQRERAMVLVAATTGLRRGELIALRWRDLDFDACLAHITHSTWRNVEGDTKTQASRKPVPLPAIVVAELKSWRRTSLYRSDNDFLFPSISKNGNQPVQPDMILKRHIRPVLVRLGVTKKIGWHSFRHGLSNQLRQGGVEIKTAQELLRHANSRITLDIYQRSVTQERRDAQAIAVKGLLGE